MGVSLTSDCAKIFSIILSASLTSISLAFGGFSAAMGCTLTSPKEIFLMGAFEPEAPGLWVLALGGGVTKAESSSPAFCPFFVFAAAFFKLLGSGLLPRGADFDLTLWVGAGAVVGIGTHYHLHKSLWTKNGYKRCEDWVSLQTLQMGMHALDIEMESHAGCTFFFSQLPLEVLPFGMNFKSCGLGIREFS